MSRLKVEALQREFFYNGTRIPDPAPHLSVAQVRDWLTRPGRKSRPTLAGPEDSGGTLRYTFSRTIGSKG